MMVTSVAGKASLEDVLSFSPLSQTTTVAVLLKIFQLAAYFH